MALCIKAACGSNVGRRRFNNEDNYLFNNHIRDVIVPNPPILSYEEPLRSFTCFCVFDGMGGAADGELASLLAAESFQKTYLGAPSGEELTEDFFLRAIDRMNKLVCRESAQRNNNMGTTAVIIGFSDEDFHICNVGDSRAYRLRNGILAQLSLDHLSPACPNNRIKPGLSQCIGIPEDEFLLEPYYSIGNTAPQDRFLLCTDGLTDMVEDKEIKNILSRAESPDAAVRHLTEKALQNGGTDNVTIVVIHITENTKEVL